MPRKGTPEIYTTDPQLTDLATAFNREVDMGEEMVLMNFRITPAQKRRIEMKAEETGVNVSALIRLAIYQMTR